MRVSLTVTSRTKILLVVLALAAAVLVTRLLGVWGGSGAKPTAPPPVAEGSGSGSAVKVTPAAATTSAAMQRTQEAAYDDDPAGTIRLEGQVIDAKDQPVAGARVAIDSNPPKTVVTEADGAFVFEGLIARTYAVEATADSGYAGPVSVRLGAKPEPVTLRIKPAGTVEVAVTAADKPVAGATVELRSSLAWTAQTGADGVAKLTNVGAVWGPLAVRADGYAPFAMMLWVPGDPAIPMRVAVALAKGAPISGTVVDGAGKPVGGARVVATSLSEPFPVVDARRDGVETKADGTFALPAIAAGTWRLTATQAERAPGTSTPLTVDGVHARSGVKIVLEAGAVVRGTVKDSKGAPVASADVRVVVRGAEFLRARRDAFTAADGTFTIKGLARRAVDVVASHETGSSAIVPADLATKTEVDVALTLDVTGAIEGTVVDSAGGAIGDAQVVAEPVWSGGTADREAWAVRGSSETVTDQGGGFRFAGLPDGEYKIRASRTGGWAALELAKVTLAKPNGPKLKIIVPGDGQVSGKVAFADGKVPASFTVALGSTDPKPFATKDGTFTVPAVAGTHKLVVDGRGFLASKAKDVTIVEGKTADAGTIVVTPGRSVSGRVLDSAGMPVAKATVAAGTLLSGGGTELYIENESVGAKSTETDADGRFSIEGFPPAAITVVAGKTELGRSGSIRLPASPDSASLELVLQKTSGLEGTITRDGKPLGDTVVIANPLGAVSSNFFVTTGPDGTFALDALAPGAYVIYPMIGGGGNRPKDMYIRKVTVTAGARAKIAIDATPGPVAVTVNVKTASGTKPPMAQLFMVQATIAPHTVSELRSIDQLDAFGDDPIPMHMRGAMGGSTEVAGVRPGQYTACIIAVFGPPPDDPDTLPIKCVPAKIGAGPKQTIDVVVPDPKP